MQKRDHSSSIHRRNLADHAARWTIQGIAFVSFAVILLIFVFVFKEAARVFDQEASTTSSEFLQSETYGEDPADTTSAQLPSTQAAAELSAQETAGAEGRVTFRSLLSTEWQPVSAHPRYGLLPLFVGSLKVTLVAVVFGATHSILSDMYSDGWAPRRLA